MHERRQAKFCLEVIDCMALLPRGPRRHQVNRNTRISGIRPGGTRTRKILSFLNERNPLRKGICFYCIYSLLVMANYWKSVLLLVFHADFHCKTNICTFTQTNISEHTCALSNVCTFACIYNSVVNCSLIKYFITIIYITKINKFISNKSKYSTSIHRPSLKHASCCSILFKCMK